MHRLSLKSLNKGRRQHLRENVGELLRGRYMCDTDFTDGHLLPNNVNVQFNMLRSFVVDWVLRHVDRRYVVAEHQRGLYDLAAELAKKVAQPCALRDCVRHAPVFRLGTGS
jgi:hypothetical protein